MSFLSPVTNVIYTGVSWVLLRWHQFFTFVGMDPNGGLTWSLSIIFLVITARILLFRFFIKQVHYQRQMQELQPQIAKLKEKHKGDRQALNKAMMEMQSEQGMNALAGCLPMFLQIPVFLGLFHVLRHLANSAHRPTGDRYLTLYGFTAHETKSAATAKLFGSSPLASSFHDSAAKVASLGGDLSTLRVVTVVLAVISAGATYLTQRAVQKNATVAPTGQMAQVQKLMLYVIPVFVLGSGVFFPLGVLLYWFSSNLWTLGQQFYIFRFHPHVPGQKLGAKSDDEVLVKRALAPPPGAKPQRNRTPAASAREVKPPVVEPAGTVRSSTPRPGSRPGGGKPRSTNSRPGQRSKRR